MTAWVVCALCALVILKPQEVVPAIAGLPLLHIAFAAALALGVADVLRGKLRLSLAPQVPFICAFMLWGLATTALKSHANLVDSTLSLAIVMGVFASVAFGSASLTGVRVLSATLVGCAAVVASVALAQRFQPYVCMLAAPEDWAGWGQLVPDGRPCTEVLQCREDPPVPNGNYRCERPGPLATSTSDGRIRYRGSLADPNELSLTCALIVPIALSFAEVRARARRPSRSGKGPAVDPDPSARPRQRWTWPRALPAAAFAAAAGVVVVLSRSRTGLIVYLVVLALCFVRKLGAWGVVVGCLIGPPIALIGGRSGAEATQSADDRVALLREAFHMVRQTKGIGVGVGQFGEASSIGMNAHNAYLMAASEAGIVGVCLFTLALYASLKAPLVVWLGGYKVDATIARLAPAIFISLCGALVGIFFLSWAYKDILYIAIGASAALYGAARAEDPRIHARVSLREVALVVGGTLVLLAVVYAGLRLRG